MMLELSHNIWAMPLFELARIRGSYVLGISLRVSDWAVNAGFGGRRGKPLVTIQSDKQSIKNFSFLIDLADMVIKI
jgi:hypothetical protein